MAALAARRQAPALGAAGGTAHATAGATVKSGAATADAVASGGASTVAGGACQRCRDGGLHGEGWVRHSERRG